MLLSSWPNKKICKPKELLQFFVEYGDENIFPNLRLALQILLAIAVSIASYENTFSNL